MFRALCAYHQEVKIALHSLWYHHTETSEWSKITNIQFYKYEQILLLFASSWLITKILPFIFTAPYQYRTSKRNHLALMHVICTWKAPTSSLGRTVVG